MRLAALDCVGLLIEGTPPLHRRVSWPHVRTAGDLFRAMRRSEITVLYIHRSALALMELPDGLPVPRPGEKRAPHPWLDGVQAHGERVSQRALSPAVQCADMELMIGAYQDGAGDPFDSCADGNELLAAVCVFRDAFISEGRPLGWAYRHSAITTGWRLMHVPWRYGRRARKIGDALEQPELMPVHELQGVQVEVPYGGKWARAEAEPAWLHPSRDRAFPAMRPQLSYVHAYDVNGQRLAAASRLRCGIGEPMLLDGWGADGNRETLADISRRVDLTQPGYHLVKSVSDPFPGRIPPIFEPGWHTTPRVAMAVKLGLTVECDRRLIWEEHLPYLDPFYEAFRDARANLLECADEANAVYFDTRPAARALGALKQAYLQPFGRLRSEKSRRSGSRHYRPSWYDQLIGRELATEWYRLWMLARERVSVLAVYFDTIIIESIQADAVEAAKPLELSGQLGKYKIVGSLGASDARMELYGGEHTPDVGALMKRIKGARTVSGEG